MIRRFVVLMLLAWLPIQASAMPLLGFRCDQHDSSKQESAVQQVGHGHHSAVAGDHDPAGGHDSDSPSNAHSCCHHFSGVVPTMPAMTGIEISGAVASSAPARLHDFIPDLLQRPPLARLV